MSRPSGWESAPRAEACHDNWVTAVASIAAAVPGGSLLRREGLTIVRSGLAISAFNCAFVFEPPRDLEGVAEELARTLVNGPHPWCLVTVDRSANAIEPLVRRFRLGQREVLPGMVWQPLPRTPPPVPPGLEVRRIRELEDIPAFGRTMMQAFEARADLLDPWIEGVMARGVLPGGGLSLYLGSYDGRPVGTAARCTTPSIAGVYWVGTTPEFRRRGWGAAMTCQAALDGREEGCELSYLQSSREGHALYRSIGYRRVEEYQLWAPEAPLPPTRT